MNHQRKKLENIWLPEKGLTPSSRSLLFFIMSIKRDGFKDKIELDFLMIVSNPIAKYLIYKIIF